MLVSGPPSRWSAERLERFAHSLFARAVDSERARRDNPSRQALLERRREQAKIVYSDAARVAAVRQLEAALGQLEERAECAYGSWTPRAELARELGVTSVRLGRWLARGKVPPSMMPLVSEWAERRAEAELLRMRNEQLAHDLIQRAKTPGQAHALPGMLPRQSVRAPDIQSHEGPYENIDNAGYKWDRRIEEWSSFELISRLSKWALSRVVPPKFKLGRLKFWIVTALVSVYDPPESLRGSDERRQRRRKSKSPGAYRQFERRHDPKQMSRHLELGAVVSSSTVPRGGLALAVKRWRENMIIEHCENELVFVHALIVRTWRARGPRERERYYQKQQREYEQSERGKQQKREREHHRAAERARKKALGRRGSRRR